MTTRTRLLAPALALTSALLLTTTAPALAKDGDIRTSGSCSGTADWKVKASSEDGGIEIEGEIDSNVAGQKWRWRLKHNGTVVAKGKRTTAGRSGSFEVRRVVGNRAGTDRFVFRAKRVGGSQVCRGTVRF